MKNNFLDVIVVGGSYAGLSAATLLGRSRREVLVIDSGSPRNKQTPVSHSYLTRDGEDPARISAIAREQLKRYKTVRFLVDNVVQARQTDNGFEVATGLSQTFAAKKLLLATGVSDIMPSIPGFAECWGKSVLHCPYCHGYEEYGKVIGIIGNGDRGFTLTRLLYNWSKQVTLFTNGPSTLTGEQKDQLTKNSIRIVEEEISSINHKEGYLDGINLKGQKPIQLDAIFAWVEIKQHSDLAQQLGVTVNEDHLLDCNDTGKTNIEGVFVAGDNSSAMKQVAIAGANGLKAGIQINSELVVERF